ncbi:MAG: MgtC/SapB family protein [Candidatus Aenigmarchaeota archaeon]|nr:MgtC/SapB family protein [Candidatus Aenigmarchaeota archaeon]
MMIGDYLLLQKIALSLAIGALIGIERERRGSKFLVAGFRTFMLVCLFGLLSGFFSDLLGTNLMTLISFLTVSTLSISSYVINFISKKLSGQTTEMAFLITFLIGLLIYYQSFPYLLPIILSIILALILFSKEQMHKFAKNITRKELWHALIFGIIVFIILPILPNRAIDPTGILNPFIVWLSLVIVISVSFVGYVLMKIFGVKMGLSLTGLFGGLVSSTAVTLDMCEKVKNNSKILYSASFATALASTTMFLKTILISYLINYNVAVILFIPFLILSSFGYFISFFIWKKGIKEKTTIELGSPLALKPAIKFTALFVVLLFISHLANRYFGEISVYPISIISGLINVNAITITLSYMAFSGITIEAAVKGIILACLTNTLSKWLLVNSFGSKKMTLETGKIFSLLMIMCGILLLFQF